MSRRVKLLEVRSTYLDSDEQGVFNDVGEVHLEVLWILSYVRVVLRVYADLEGLHNSAHTDHLFDPLSPSLLPPDSV